MGIVITRNKIELVIPQILYSTNSIIKGINTSVAFLGT